MAMINDKGPEESRDTDATYIMLSHQSVHLPGPLSAAGGTGCVGGVGGVGGGEVEHREAETAGRRWRRERELSTQSPLRAGIASLFLLLGK